MELAAGIARRHFAVLGRAGMDLWAHPPGVASERATDFRAGLGGSSANIAAGLCKLGCSAALVTSVSDDAVGRFCQNELVAYGVDIAHIRKVAGERRTSLAIYESRIEEFQNVIYRNGAADFEVSRAQIDALDLSPYGALITTGTVFAAEPSRSAHFHAFERARSARLPVIFDIDYRPYSWASAAEAAAVLTRAGEAAQMIVGNDEEFAFMAGEPGAGLARARDLAAGGRMVIYKMGARGAITLWQGAEIRTGIFPVTAIKPNGAGDAFMAGLLAGLAGGQALRDAVLQGSACAAIVVGSAGCAPAMSTPGTLAAFRADHPQPVEVQ